MSCVIHVRALLGLALAAFVGAPSVATAGPHGGGHHGGVHASHGTVSHGAGRGGHVGGGSVRRAPLRDHRAAAQPGHRPYLHHGPTYWPGWPYGAWTTGHRPYHSGYARYEQPYLAGPPGAVGVTAPPPAAPPRRSRLAVAAHVGQLERDDDVSADLAGLALRWRGRALEAEVELGRHAYADAELTERTVAGAVYLNLGEIDALHPYLLAGAGLLGNDRVFGAVGAGLALPVASRLTLTGDARMASIAARDHHRQPAAPDARARSLEGRLSLIVDF